MRYKRKKQFTSESKVKNVTVYTEKGIMELVNEFKIKDTENNSVYSANVSLDSFDM